MTWPTVNVALLPVLATASFHWKVSFSVTSLLVALLVLVTVRSAGLTTVTVFEQVLLFSLVPSAIRVLGSTAHTPAARGLANVPSVVVGTLNVTSKPLGAPSTTEPPAALHLSVLNSSMAQLIVPAPVTPVAL